MKRPCNRGIRSRRGGESGQALVEFALVLFPLLILVGGIVQFGIGLSYWHDQNRIANQGARWAVADAWPGCPVTQATCTSNPNPPVCTGSQAGRSLQHYLRCQVTTAGLRRSMTVTLCHPTGTSLTVGDPITVQLRTRFGFVPVLQIGTITLQGKATMRIEKTPTKITGVVTPCP